MFSSLYLRITLYTLQVLFSKWTYPCYHKHFIALGEFRTISLSILNSITLVSICSHLWSTFITRCHTIHRPHQRYKSQPSTKHKAISPAIPTTFTKKQFALFARKKMSKEAADILISRCNYNVHVQYYWYIHVYAVSMCVCSTSVCVFVLYCSIKVYRCVNTLLVSVMDDSYRSVFVVEFDPFAIEFVGFCSWICWFLQLNLLVLL